MFVVIIVFHPERFLSFWWQKYTDPSGHYSLEFPSKPETSDLRGKLDGGDAVMHVVYAVPNRSTKYFFTYGDDSRFASKPLDEAFNLWRDEIISSMHGALLDEQRIQIDGHQARDIQARDGAGLNLNLRLIADGPRSIVLEVVTVGQKADSKSVQKFFESLEFSK